MEIDLRRPYKRFKQLHPNNYITYEEYKKNTSSISIQTHNKLTKKPPNGTIKTTTNQPHIFSTKTNKFFNTKNEKQNKKTL
jgi:hypothetical protein